MQIQNRWPLIVLLFGIVPLMLYLAVLRPSIGRIYDGRDRIYRQVLEASHIDLGPEPATTHELERLEKIKTNLLAKIKKVETRESLLQFTGLIADALALHGGYYGLQVVNIDLNNELVRGKYVPAHIGALKELVSLPGLQGKELQDPLDIPTLNLPSIEIQMTVAGPYSRVFSFIESFAGFPVLISLVRLNTVDNREGRAFQLAIRAYYYGVEKIQPEARLQDEPVL